jgi:hypothetical protein
MYSRHMGATSRFSRLLPWIAGIIGAVLFLRPLLAAPATTVLNRTFWYDALANTDDFAAIHESLSRGLGSSNFYDWLYSDRLFFPQPRPLVTSELIPIGALATWPFAGAPVLAHNLALFLACVLNVVAGAHLARVAGARPISATLAGLGFAFCAYTNFSSARVQLMFLFPVLFCLASLLQWARDGRTRHAILAAVWAFVQTGLALYYALFLAFTLPIAVLALRLSTKRPGFLRETAILGVSFLAAGAASAAMLLPYRQLSTHLGLARPYGDVIAQSGFIEMFAWADTFTLFGKLIPDRMAWDSACFPGAVVALGAVLGLILWTRGSVRSAIPALILGAAAILFAALKLFPLSLAALGLIVIWMVWRARAGNEPPHAVLFAVLLFVGLFLFFGPAPRSFERSLGASPYAWMYHHLPLLDGLRVARRAAVLIQAVLCTGAALLFSRIEARRWGGPVVLLLAAFTLFEGIPFNLKIQRVPDRCTDPALIAAKEEGATAVGELMPKDTPHDDIALSRHQATLCGIFSTAGNAGFTPPLAVVAKDALQSLPDAAAHRWLWDAGVRHVLLRRTSSRTAADRLRELQPIASRSQSFGRDALITLQPPSGNASLLASTLSGAAIPIRTVESRGQTCADAFDQNEKTNWQSRHTMRGNEELIVRFDERTVSALEWHAFGVGTDLPRGLRIEREVSPGEWAPWGEWPSISPLALGRNAVTASLAFPLPPERTSAMRLTQLGRTHDLWLSASELVVRGQ